MPRFLNPPTLPRPSSRHAHGVVHGVAAKRLVISPQPGVRADGAIPDGLRAGVEAACDRVLAILAAAGMAAEDVLRLTVATTEADGGAVAREAATAKFGAATPAFSYLQVAGLGEPGLRVTVDAEAVRET
ncbi:MAG: hypothetical protein KGI57_00985 [Hyphomicrobiales bacterium]|nr:hypothetical protein [Hyphomicrobiales bacterium]MDE2016259.1 hypothetical protein [Hyphomicrobiales bacterium]